jgi:hypothetical protein
MSQGKPVNWTAAIVIVGIWVGQAILSVSVVSKYFLPNGIGVSEILSVGFFEYGNPYPK